MEKFYVTKGRIGNGVFARVPIEPLETIFFVTGRLIDYTAARDHPSGENTFQIGSNSYIYPLYPSRFLNHSCEPNAGLKDDIKLVALRQIRPGEEITFDYSTSMLERDWEMPCRCATPACRQLVQDFDLLPPDLQKHYISLGIVQQFIINELSIFQEA